MTKRNKVIVGVVAVLVAYYIYDRYAKKREVAKLKSGADVKPLEDHTAPAPTPIGLPKRQVITSLESIKKEEI